MSTRVMPESAFAELKRRQERERLKALGKYGSQALDPGGDPSRDVLDYALGELAGLERYAEMIEARYSDARGKRMAKNMRQLAELLGVDLILFRRSLVERGVSLGASEYGD